jgi:hypothetical protein
MRVNRQFYEEAFDLIYSSFAVYVVPYFKINPLHLHDWLYDLNPRALKIIRHFALSFSLVVGPRDVKMWWDRSVKKSDYIAQVSPEDLEHVAPLREYFKNVTSVLIYVATDENILESNSHIAESEWVEVIRAQAKYWKDAGVKSLVSAHLNCGPKGRRIIAEAQRLEGQVQNIATAYDQGIN